MIPNSSSTATNLLAFGLCSATRASRLINDTATKRLGVKSSVFEYMMIRANDVYLPDLYIGTDSSTSGIDLDREPEVLRSTCKPRRVVLDVGV